MVVVKAIAKVIAKMPLFVAVHKEYTSAVFCYPLAFLVIYRVRGKTFR